MAGRKASGRRLAALCAALLAALGCGASVASASVPELFARFPADGLAGEGAGRFSIPVGIATQAEPPGHLYVADYANDRVDELDAWGSFVRAFGWGVADGVSEELQVCTSECHRGLGGSGSGQFDRPASVALDSGGNIYVLDRGNARVQKFDPEGQLLLGFGWGVRDGAAEAQTCGPAASPPSAKCLAGKSGGGAGQITNGGSSSRLAIGAGDTVFLADGERIERFSSAGAFEEEIVMPAGNAIESIVVDGEGKLYVSFTSGAELNVIRKLEPTAPYQELEPDFVTDGEGSGGRIAVDAAGHLYTLLGPQFQPNEQPNRVLEFDGEGECLNCGSEGEDGSEGFDRSQKGQLEGIGAGGPCGSANVYVSHRENATIFGDPARSYVKIFGPHPDPALCPPPKLPPSIEASYAAAVGSDDAELRAQINPHYWDDTTYYLEYGTAPCSEGGCAAVPAPPGRQLSATVTGVPVSATVSLEGLQPATTYHYRFVASGSGSEGEEVRGTGGSPGADGAEGTFTTYAPIEPSSGCANDAFRPGPGAYLADCRAYEMVSPLDKNNGNVVPPSGYAAGTAPGPPVKAGIEQSSLSGDRLAYSSATAFADAVSSPWSSQYVAQRIAGFEWETHAISPPRGRLLGREEKVGLVGHDTEFKILSPDLCQAWLRTMTDLSLAPEAVPESFDLYRREDRLCSPDGQDGYEALTTVAPPPTEELEHDGGLGVPLEAQGVSADEGTAIYKARDSLPGTGAPDSLQDEDQLYVRGPGGQTRFACVMPAGAAVSCLAGTTLEANISNYWSSLAGAISADGSRVFWSSPARNGGAIFARENPLAAPSAQAHGFATGTGRLVEGSAAVTLLSAAKGSASLTEGSNEALLAETSVGRWVAGQPISGSGIPAGTTVSEVSGSTLVLSAPATATGTEVTVTSKGPLPFAVGQTIVGDGVPAGATIAEVKAGGLTLSAPATASSAPLTSLEAFSQCTEADKACTVAVSAAGEALSGAESSRFLGASPDGGKVLYLAKGGGASDLYELDLASEATHKIAGGVAGIMGASEGLGIVYFISSEAIAGSGAGSQGVEAQPGKPNLYRYDAGEGGDEYRFIAELAPADADGGESEKPIAGPITLAPPSHVARVSADGSHLAFASAGQPTGYDNADQASGEPDAEAYLYDAAAQGGQGELLCVSCNPSGARPAGREESHRWVAASIAGWENSFYAPRALSADGSRLYFTAIDALLPRDANGRADVYQWEAPGTGSCTQADPSFFAANGGCLSLISSGTSPRDSEFRDASPSGEDVFFATASSLLPQDYGLIDVYDARVQGGLPGPVAPPPSCEGEACQSPPEAPNDPTPASSAFEGAGNVGGEEGTGRKSCPKGRRKVRRAGKVRCLKRHPHTHSVHHRRSHNHRRAAR